MAELEMETVNVFFYGDLEKLIKELYDQEISITDLIPFELMGQNTYHEFTVDGESELDSIGDEYIVQKWIDNPGQTSFDTNDIPEIDWTNERSLDVRHILHRLFKDGVIPQGKYIMTIWW